MARRKTGAQIAASRKNIAIARQARTYSSTSKAAAVAAMGKATARVSRAPRGALTISSFKLPTLPKVPLQTAQVQTLPKAPARKPAGARPRPTQRPAQRSTTTKRTVAGGPSAASAAKAAMTPRAYF